MRHIISILLENEAGALSRVAGLFSARGYNIETLTVAPTEDMSLSRLTIVTSGSDEVIEQITKQLNKLIDVIKIINLDEAPFISYELAMIKVRYDTPQVRDELASLANLFHAKVVDVNLNSLILRVTGREDHVNALIKVLSPYEILEIARTGTISLSRGLVPVKAM